ncbi:MAG: AsmA-like C-terminal region-containing protein, partial [Elusimicrobia bacterium]|nr:AsmA-like C-terminal region-containing protein [Elusimicrobiota bacterium]
NRVSATVAGVAFRGSGGLAGAPASSFDLDLFAPKLGPDQWRALLGRELDVTLPPARWRLRAGWPGGGLLQVRRLRVDSPPLSLTASGTVDPAGAALEAEIGVSEFPLSRIKDIHPPSGRLGLEGILSGSLTLAGPWSRLRPQRGAVRIERACGRFGGFSLDGGSLSVSAPRSLDDVVFSVAGGEGRILSGRFSELDLSARLRRGDLKLDRLAARIFDSKIALKGLVRRLANPKEVLVDGSIDRLRWEEAQGLVSDAVVRISTQAAAAPERTWLSAFKYAIPKHFPDTAGHIMIGSVAHKNFAFNNVDMLWDIRGVSPSLSQVSGDVRVSFGPGRIADIPAVQAANKFLRIVFLPFVYMHKMNNLSVFSAATVYPKTLDFTRIEGEYGLKRGVASTRLFSVDSPQMAAFASGTADFARETVDMNILTRLTGYRDPLPEWWVDELGRPAIAFRVNGSLGLPDLDPRLSKMGGDEIEKAVEDARAKAKKRYAALEKLRGL